MVLVRGLLAGLVAFFLLAFFYLRAPYLHDSDSYLHLAVARLYTEQGLVKALPWPRFSVMSETSTPEEALKALQTASGYLHKELVHRLEMRRVPFLEFKLDTSISEGAAMLAHLEEVRREEGNNR